MDGILLETRHELKSENIHNGSKGEMKMTCGTKNCKTTTKKTTTTKKKTTTPSTEFVLTAPEAQEVYLVGDFNDWNGEGYKMRRFKGGVFKKKVPLKTGQYEYRFVVDGDWWTDPANPNRQPNAFGSENSVIEVC